MGAKQLAVFGVTALALANPCWAQGAAKLPPTLGMTDDVELIPYVNPGDQIGIACNALNRSTDNDVRVVLTISAEPGSIPPGYKRVLATDAQVAHGAVRVRIPSTPDLEDHLVNVNVYVLDNGASQNCDAGHMKIVRQRVAGAPGDAG